MKTVMVLIHDDSDQESRLQCALDAVRALDGHLICLDVMRLPVVADGFGLDTASATLIVDEREREDKNIARLSPRLAVEGVSHEWLRVMGNGDTAITDSIRLADLIVVGRRDIGDILDSGDLATRLAEHVRAPVLLVPTGQASLDICGKALVCWDGSAPCDTAVRAAVPLLKLAQSVEVLSVGVGEEAPSANEAAAYLARHGCNVTSRQIAPARDVPAQLLGELASSGAQWAVMGSYSRSRLREHLFGGASRTIFAQAAIPLLIAH